MRLRTLRARGLPEAMRQLRAELGEDVIIIASRETADGVEVTAAEEHGEEDLTALLAPAAAGSVQAEVAAALGFHGVPPAVRGVLEAEVARAQAGDAQGALADALARQVRFEALGLPTGRAVALVGPPGAGKTAVVARIAAAARLAGRPIVVLCGDTARAGGLEQLRALVAPLGLEPEPVGTPSDVEARVRADAVVLVDTAGVNPFRSGEVARLAQWLAPARAEVALVLPAGTDAQDAIEIVGAFAAAGARRCVATRIDAARRVGAVVAAGAAGLTLGEASVSPLIGKPMPPLTPAGLARLLLRRAAGEGKAG